MALRRSHGFVRYALAIQYHGGSFLGCSYQGPRGEDCVSPDGRTDLRGVQSVEGRIRDALSYLVGPDNHENLKVSSRTDRGVHALKNTAHVDVRLRRSRTHVAASMLAGEETGDSGGGSGTDAPLPWDPLRLQKGLNYYLSRPQIRHLPDAESSSPSEHNLGRWAFRKWRRRRQQRGGDHNHQYGTDPNPRRDNIRILSAALAPFSMPNPFHRPDLPDSTVDNPRDVDWSARFSATKRTYVYRILHCSGGSNVDRGGPVMAGDCHAHAIPFEHDVSWRLHDPSPLDVDAMNASGGVLVGRHDFTSFRGKGCQRKDPVVALDRIQVTRHLYGHPAILGVRRPDDGGARWGSAGGGLLGLGGNGGDPSAVSLVTVAVSGESFLYRQVRNIVGCLVEVGRGRLGVEDVGTILRNKNRSIAPAMAPPHGLFLVDVEHGEFHF